MQSLSATVDVYLICQGGGTKKSIKEKASPADQVSMNNVLGDKTPCHESEDDLEDVNENSLSLPKSGEAICDPTRLELGINNGDEEFSAGNLKDSPSFEGMHAGGELSLPPWGTMVSENNRGQWTGLASSENSRNRRYVLAKNKMILPPWDTDIQECGDGPWEDAIPGNMSECGYFFLSHKMRIYISLQHCNEMRKKSNLARMKRATELNGNKVSKTSLTHPLRSTTGGKKQQK